MKILHYTLGLPPYRTGGLTKYTLDLMQEQIRNNDEVFLIFPGRIELIKNEPKISHYKNIKGIKVYEVVNPLPVPLMDGVCNAKVFHKDIKGTIYEKFLIDNGIELINIHTLMGLHKEFLIAAKKLNIPIIYTTHDYYGLCTKVNFLDNNGQVCLKRDIQKCLKCNANGKGMKQIKILQSRAYRTIKNTGIIDRVKYAISSVKIKKTITKNIFYDTEKIDSEMKSYNQLLENYKQMFDMVDEFIFNSNTSKEIYSSYLTCKGEVLSLTHKDIKDNRRIRSYEDNVVKLTYLGPDKEYKGYYLLSEAVNEIVSRGHNDVVLNVYGNTSIKGKVNNNIKVNGKYSYEQLEQIFNDTDVLIVPSRWYETFGFITLEALSYGVPVIITNKVGSKDIIKNYENGIIIEDDKEHLINQIISIKNDRMILKKINENICKGKFNFTIQSHYNEVNNVYKRVLKEKSNDDFRKIC